MVQPTHKLDQASALAQMQALAAHSWVSASKTWHAAARHAPDTDSNPGGGRDLE